MTRYDATDADDGARPGSPLMEGVADEPREPDCQIDGCDRSGTVPRKMRTPDSEEPVIRHYVCRYHHRLFLAARVGILALVVVAFLVVFFRV